jgi:cystathionine beta-lyase/cystathionine gamma-synthase
MFQTAFQVNAFQNNAFQIVIVPPTPSGLDGHDGFTREEIRRAKALDKKMRQMQAKRDAEFKAENERRKQLWRDQIDPQPVVEKQQKKRNKLQSKQEVTVDTPSQLAAIDAYIANLERQKQDLYQAVVVRQAKLRLEEELRMLEAKRQQELDDEESILALIL